jgi:hypothetical protein
MHELEIRTDDEGQFVLLRLDVGSHHARHGALVSDGDAGVPELRCTRDKLLTMRRAAQKGEV